MNLKSLTENRYTLNDIFVKNSEGWLAVALLMFPLAHIVHILVFTFLNKPAYDWKTFSTVLLSGEYPGDYFVVILYTAFLFIIITGLIGIISKAIKLVKDRKQVFSALIPLIMLLAFCTFDVVSTILNKTPNGSLVGYTSLTGEGALTILIYVFFFWVGTMIEKEENKYIISYAVLGVSLVNAVMTVVDRFIITVPIVSYATLAAVFYNINFYAYFLTIAIMLSAALVLKAKGMVRRIFAFVSLCINSLVLAMNNTFGCFVACVVAFIVMVIADSVIRKRISFAALGLFGLFLAICFITSFWFESFFTQIIGLFTDLRMILLNDENADDAGTLRWGLWVNTVKLIKEKPWIGYGYEGFAKRLIEYTGQGKPHNEYLEYAADFGVPAAIVYVGSLIYIYIKAFIKRSKIDGATFCALVAAFGYIGSAFFGNSKVYVTPFFFMLLGFSNTIPATPEAIPANSPAEVMESSPEPDTAPEAETGKDTEENSEEITEENTAESEADMQEADE